MTKRDLTLPITILFLYAASACLNISFRQHLLPQKAEADIIERMFGSLRVFVGDWAFIKAEEYHHRGLPFEKALAYHQGELMSAERASRTGPRKEHTEVAETPHEYAGLYMKLYPQVKVTADSHLKPAEEKEVLPWFYIEVAFNPYDIRGYVLGAYWLDRVGRREESFKFLREGEKNNPGSAQILSALGELYFREGDYDDAAIYLERARRLWLEGRGVNVASNSYMDSDRIFAFDLLASLYTRKGDYKKALQLYRELLKFGSTPAILQKIKEIELKI